mgnify:CR=1 FL=1
MAKYKKYNYNQEMLVPVNLLDQLVPGTIEFTIHHLIENMPSVAKFNERYKNDDTGCPAYDPKILLKIILLGYSRGLISSRDIEQACRENILFMALACGQTPDYSTIATFVSSMHGEIIPLFQNILLVCDERNLLGGSCFALDGVKLSSNASLEWSGTIDELKQKQERLQLKLERLLKQHIASDENDSQKSAKSNHLENKIKELEKSVTKLQSWLENAEPKEGQKRKELKSNITDNDSATMTTSHGTIQGYNAQALVDSKHQIIIHAEAMGNCQDSENLPPMIEGAKENVKAIGKGDDYFKNKPLLGDANFHSETNLKKCAQEELDAYIPNVSFRSRDPRMAPLEQLKSGHVEKRFTSVDFEIDVGNKFCKCPAGKQLKYKGRCQKGQAWYFKFVANTKNCRECPLRSSCLSSDKTKSRYLYIFEDHNARRTADEMLRKFDTEEGRNQYDHRIGIVEPVFGNIRAQKDMNKFTLRSKIKVNIQWMLYSIVHNMEKIAHYANSEALQPC